MDDEQRPGGGSRARAGGSARPVGEPSRPAAARGGPGTAGPADPGGDRETRAPGVPPSFAPSGAARPRAGTAIGTAEGARAAAGGPTVQRTPAARPAHPRVSPSGGSAPPPAVRPAWSGAGAPPRPPVAPPPARDPRGPVGPPPPPRTGTATGILVGGGRGRRRGRRTTLLAMLLVLLLAWPLGLLLWANGKIQHVDALAATADTPGTTYLLAGSDSRGGDGGIVQDGTEGARTDTIMVLHVPPSGPPALISLPRDTYAEIPGEGFNKLNAAYSWGGAPLLVATVEELTGMHMDHYVEIGLGGVANVVDALGGVELCLDPAVNQVSFPLDDPDSGLVWDAPGCRVVDGATSLAFARMRKADREGDIGRAKRQQQLIAALSSQAATPSLVVHPGRQVGLVDAGLGALQVSDGTGIIDLGRLGLAFRGATGPEGIRGTPPISDADYRPGGIGSAVQLDPETTPQFFADIMNGTLPPGPVGGMPPA